VVAVGLYGGGWDVREECDMCFVRGCTLWVDEDLADRDLDRGLWAEWYWYSKGTFGGPGVVLGIWLIRGMGG
jgi:hypothetical protein